MKKWKITARVPFEDISFVLADTKDEAVAKYLEGEVVEDEAEDLLVPDVSLLEIVSVEEVGEVEDD